MYKFATKSEDDYFKAGVFYNGQKLVELLIEKEDDEFHIRVYDGNDFAEGEWHDYEESD